jgi:hypothetical protein
MSEQDAASVDRFLDGLDDRRDEAAGENARRRSGAAVPKWEYMTWTTSDTKAGRSVRLVNGERLEEYRLEHPALVEAGAQGWELVSVVPAGGRQDHALYFKRPMGEG